MDVKKGKRGFTLVELIVVLAILAVVAAIAVPTALGSIQKAKDAAGKASIQSFISVARTGGTLAQIDGAVLHATASNVTLNYENGVFTANEFNPSGVQDFIDYFLKAYQTSGMQTPSTAKAQITFSYDVSSNQLSIIRVEYRPDKSDNVYYEYNGEENKFFRYDRLDKTEI